MLTASLTSTTLNAMTRAIKADASIPCETEGDAFSPPVEIVRPARIQAPFVFASPHSGRLYPPAFMASSALDALTLRASEDAFVDELFNAAPSRGAALVAARFPRAYLDVNRDPWELDPAMFADPLPAWAKTRTPRVAAGLGTVPRIVADGTEIYRDLLSVREAEERVRRLHRPYHRTLERLLAEARARFGAAALIDCHSMPSVGGPGERDSGRDRVDVVIGDRFGASCSSRLSEFLATQFSGLGYRVARNAPYAGGWTTERYGRPARGQHAVQIELNRALYLNEASVERTDRFAVLQRDVSTVIEALVDTADTLLRRA